MPTRQRLAGSGVPFVCAVSVVAVAWLSSSVARQHLAVLATGALISLLLLPRLTKHPTFAVCVLLAVFPLQLPVLALAYTHGLPATIARALGAVKDLMLVALALRAFLDRSSHKWRSADRWLAAYLAIATTFLVLPTVVESLVHVPLNQRLLAWRIDCFYVVTLLALRRMRADALDLRLVRGTIIGMGLLVASIAVFEYYQPNAWRTFFYSDLGVQRYSADVLASHLTPDTFTRYGSNGGVRAKSLISDPVFCGFYLLPGIFLCLRGIAAGRWARNAAYLTVIGSGLLATATRAAVLVGLIGIVVTGVLILGSGRKAASYLAPVLAVGVLVLPVVAAGSPVVNRVGQALAGQDESARGHANDFDVGFARARTHPLGDGLGSGAGVGQRFDVAGTTISENAYLQVVNELGVVAAVCFVGFLVSLLLELRSRASDIDDVFLDRVAALALLIAMLLGGMLQQVWYDFAVSSVVAVTLALPFLRSSEPPFAERDAQSLLAGADLR